MSNEVYANGREIACKAAAGKTIAAFPDVCLSPPSPPAGPVPIPYPNTAYASDTSNGSTTVKISDKEIMLKDRSVFKKSTGNEAATKSLGMGVVTHTIQGEASFAMWSMDVKFEGANVDRHLDMTLHNEQCTPPNAGPWPYVDKNATGRANPCKAEKKAEKEACSDFDPHTRGGGSPCGAAGLNKKAGDLTKNEAIRMAEDIQRGGAGKKKKNMTAKEQALECVKARRCELGPYSPSKCCPSQTPDHVLPKASFYAKSTEGNRLPGWGGPKGYDPDAAPCMCAEGPNNTWGSHGLRHCYHKNYPPEVGGIPVSKGAHMPFSDAVSHAAESSAEVFRAAGCSQECVEHQVKQGHKGMFQGKSPPEVKYAPSGSSQEQGMVDARIMDLNEGP